jgi:glycolate oxidase subunit GlcD
MDRLIENLRAVVGHNGVLAEPDELLVYECDGLPQHKQRPRAVVFPRSTEETAAVLSLLAKARVPFAPRGAGTGLSGGATVQNQGVVIEMARMRRLLKIDADNQFAIVETGLINAQLSRRAAPHHLYYAPDPSSQTTCTIGGNIAENAGGIHCLKYGVTVDHVLAARVVLADGRIIELGNAAGADSFAYDLLGVFIGSEGTFGIATEATLRLLPVPPAVRTLLADFADVNDASRAVSAIIANGLIPSALEMMDGATIRAVEASVFAAGIPPDAEAALLIELDGLEAGLDAEATRAEEICLRHGARGVRRAGDERERKKLWAARKGAFGAMGRLSPDLMLQDAVVPRSRLPEVLAATYRIGAKYNLLVANVFHAGDGNLHPFICFDSRKASEVKRVKEAGREIMETCVRAGGTITGEHGVGLDKRDYLPLIFSDDDMDAMLRVRAAFDPTGLCNPGKIIPTSRSCGEARPVQSKNIAAHRADSSASTGDFTRSGESRLMQTMQSEDVKPPENREAIAPHVKALAPATLPPSSPTHVLQRPASFNATAMRRPFAQIVGEENVSETGEGNSLCVAPATIAEACEALRLASREKLIVTPVGAETWPGAGGLHQGANVRLTTRRMTRSIEHEPADLVASVEAGAPLVAFNAELKRAGQCLPLDPPDDGRATVGGVAATGMSGAQGLGYGRTRGLVIGMRVALADGRLIKAGGRVVKNVAGYDLCKLFVGSYGTLGLILELTFKLRPLPAQTSTVIASATLSSLLKCARLLRAAQLLPVALELLSPRMTDNVLGKQPEDGCALLVRFAGNAETVAYQETRALELMRVEAKIKSVGVERDDEVLWRNLAALTLRYSNQLIWRAGVLPCELGALLNSAEREPDIFNASSLWHAGLGIGRLRVITEPQAGEVECFQSLERLRENAQAMGGTLVVESAPFERKNAFDTSEFRGASTLISERIKKQLDPCGTFSKACLIA